MSTGVGRGTGSLIVRKTEKGIVVEGTVPQTHSFPRKFLERELNSAIRIHVVVSSDPPVVYEITSFDGPRDSNGHLSGPYDLTGHLIPSPHVPQQKRRWWRRSR